MICFELMDARITLAAVLREFVPGRFEACSGRLVGIVDRTARVRDLCRGVAADLCGRVGRRGLHLVLGRDRLWGEARFEAGLSRAASVAVAGR